MKVRLLLPAFLLALSPLLVVHPLRIEGPSMSPALQDGRTVLALRAWCAGTPRRGEVWRIQGPRGSLVKRIAALPGERVEIREGQVWVEGRPLAEPYLSHWEGETLGPVDTGSGYFLLGDNRRESRDSRAWGCVPREALAARVLGADAAPAPH